MNDYEGDYDYLDTDPPIPSNPVPTRKELLQFEYISLAQLCRIDPKPAGFRKMRACEAFGGDRGRNEVIPERKVRAVKHGKSVRKYVLVSAVINYLKMVGIEYW